MQATMDSEIARLVQAIAVAINPTQQDKSLQTQALDFIHQVQQNAQNHQVWSMALKLFTDSESGSSMRKYDSQTRLFALRVLEDFLDNKFTALDDPGFQTIKAALMQYIQSEYIEGASEASAPFLRNKFSHTFSLFFLCTYQHQWPTFFTDLFSLIRSAPPPPTSSSSSRMASNHNQSSITLNTHICLLFFRVVLEISGEISDQLLKSARAFVPERHARDTKVKDLVRERDARGLSDAVVGIVTECVANLNNFGSTYNNQETNALEEVVEWGLKAFGSYIHWIDISLTCNPTTIQLLFSLLSSANQPSASSFPASVSIRSAAVLALQRMVSKGLKESRDKLELLRVLDLGKVLAVLEARTREQRSNDPSEEEEKYRENLGKLLSALGLELLDLTKEAVPEEIKGFAKNMVEELLPVTLQFLADEYDDTSTTVFPFVHDLLSRYKKVRKALPDTPLEESKINFLRQLATVLFEKSKLDAEYDPFDMDSDDKAQFETLRKDLRSLLEAVSVLTPDMLINLLSTFTTNILSLYESGSTLITWQHAELAVYLILSYADVIKGPAKGRVAFCNIPASLQQPTKGDMRSRKAEIDYSPYPLTVQEEMMYALIKSNVVSFPHENAAVSMQVFECAVRYPDFFKVRKECTPPILEAMIGPRAAHNPQSSIRGRAYYLLHRFIKDQKHDISSELSSTLLGRIGDTLLIDVDIPDDEFDFTTETTVGEALLEIVNHPSSFDSQMFMFEAAGTLISLLWRAPESQESVFRSLVRPILQEMEVQLQTARGMPDPKPADLASLAILVRLHHDMITLGQIARGFPDLPQILPEGYTLPPVAVFQQMVEAVLVTLDAMSSYKIIRDAARSSFAKIIGPAGLAITQYIPQLMSSLLLHSEPLELAEFMNFVGLLMHRLPNDMVSVLDELTAPLYSHISQLISMASETADDKMARLDIKKAYLSLLNGILQSSLERVFTSERNKPQLETLLRFVMMISEDVTDPASQKLAFTFLSRCIIFWAKMPSSSNDETQNNGTSVSSGIPGFERFIYEHIIPLAFKIPSLPNFNIQDGQMVTVCHEIANLIQTVCKVRGQEAYDYLSVVFLPSIQCPPDTGKEFLDQARLLDGKGFRKYFTDFVRAAKG